MKRSLVFVLSLFGALAAPLAGAEKPTVGLVVQDEVHKNWWHQAGTEAAQDVFMHAAGKAQDFQVVDLQKFAPQLREIRDALRGELRGPVAKQIGRIVSVRYLLVYNVTKYSTGGDDLQGTVDVRLIDTSTGEILWAIEVKRRVETRKPGKSFTGSDEELGALIAWLRACVGESLGRLNEAPLKL